MRILYLCNKVYWDTKLARERFFAVRAMDMRDDVEIIYDGPGFPGYIDALSSFNTFKPDVVWAYKPLALLNYDKIPNRIPKIICYNETYQLQETIKEILESRTNLVVLHHANVLTDFNDLASRGIWIANIPHCINPLVFKDYGLPKDVDILFAGVQSSQIYPLRERWIRVLKSPRLAEFKTKVLPHPGYEVKNVDDQIVHFAQELNKAKIVVSCSSIYKYALTKYLEVPACNSLLVADLPDERQDFFSQFIEPVNMIMTDDDLIDVLIHCLKDEDYRNEKCRNGLALVSEFRTYKNYCDQLMEAIKAVQ